MPFSYQAECPTCRATVREVHTRNGGYRSYNANNTRHLCFPERTDTRDPDILAHGEILLPPAGQNLPLGSEAVFLGANSSYVTIWFYDQGKHIPAENDIFFYNEFELLRLTRALRFRPEPLPESTLKTDNGWLSLSGVLYPCEYNQHIWLAGALEHEFFLEDVEAQGFIKLQKGKFYYPAISTQRQFDTMVEYVTGREEKPPARLRNMEIGTDMEVRASGRRSPLAP